MRTWCFAPALWACSGEPDPRAEHLGDCSLALVAELDGEPWYEEAILFSSFGDPLVSQTTYADGSVALAMSTYGEEPHQALSKAVDRPDEGQAGGWDERWDYTWRKGDLVERRYDLGDDGALDEVVTLEWEQHRVQRQETRLDPNGPPDQVVTYDWTETPGGWESLGSDADGVFTIEQRWDAELRVVYERYQDFYGTEYEETKGGLSSAGYVGSRQLVALDDGEPYSTTVETTTLDDRGRPLAAFRSDDLHWIGVSYEAGYTADWSCD